MKKFAQRVEVDCPKSWGMIWVSTEFLDSDFT